MEIVDGKVVEVVEVEAELDFKCNEVRLRMLSKAEIKQWGSKDFTVLSLSRVGAACLGGKQTRRI